MASLIWISVEAISFIGPGLLATRSRNVRPLSSSTLPIRPPRVVTHLWRERKPRFHGLGAGYRSAEKANRRNRDATERCEEGQEACPPVREDQEERSQAGRLRGTRQGGGGTHGQQEPRAFGRVAYPVAQLDEWIVAIAARRSQVRHESAEGPDQGAALQPGEAPADRRALEHEQEPIAASGRRKKRLAVGTHV